MLHNDNEMIFESYFHAITDIIDESRGRKKQFTERVKKIITDLDTGEERLESYYEMMKRIKRQLAADDTDDNDDNDEAIEPNKPTEIDDTQPSPEIISNNTVSDNDSDDIDVDITAQSEPFDDTNKFNFNTTLTIGDKYESAPRDSMTQDIISYIEDTPATGDEIVNYLTNKGVSEIDARNKVASLAIFDVLKLFFSDEDRISKPTSKIAIPEPDDESDDVENLDEYEGMLSDLPETDGEFDELPPGREDTEISDEDVPVDPDEFR